MKKRFNLFLLVALLLLSVACLGEGAKKAEMTLDTKVAEATGSLDTTEITASEFMEMYRSDGDFVLLDVRTKREFDSGYIPGAIHIHYTELDEMIGGLNLSKDAKIVVYCEAGVRSKKGANALLGEGYTNIIDVSDGIRGWKAIGGDIIVPAAEAKPEGETATGMVTTTSTTLTTLKQPSSTVMPTTSTTVWATQPTDAPVSQPKYLEVEPFMVIETLDGPAKVQMDHWDSIKIEDAYIYITGDFDGCSGEVWWFFNIYHDTPEGGVWEGKTKSYDVYKVHSNQDISSQIHAVSDVLDDYTIVVKKWDVQEGLTIEITR
jgi:rhodanese-related sulfurtransferase